MTTFGKRTTELSLDHELWHKGKDEFYTDFRTEDEAFKRDSELTDPLKAYARFPIAETAQHAKPPVVANYFYHEETTRQSLRNSRVCC